MKRKASRKHSSLSIPWKLYWCSTPDHDEDWFYVARSGREAANGFGMDEGYGPRYATARFVCRVPSGCKVSNASYPTHRLLQRCGRFLRRELPRVVEIKGIRYREGHLEYDIRRMDDDHAESVHGVRPNGTRRPERN